MKKHLPFVAGFVAGVGFALALLAPSALWLLGLALWLVAFCIYIEAEAIHD